MPGAVLYLAVTAVALVIWHRRVQPVRVAVAVVLVLLPLCFTGRALLTGRVYAPIDLPYASEPLKDYAADHGIHRIHNGGLSDLYTQMIPWQHTVRQSLLRGEWPLWNPHLLCGSILAANMQSAVYDPLHLLALVLTHPQALTFNAAMTFFMAGLGTFALARALALSDAAALVAAASYTLCAPLAFFVGWPLGRAWALLPLVLLAVRLVVRETSLRAAVLLTLALVLAIVAGHPESVLHLVSLGSVHGAVEVAITRRYRAVGVAALAGAVALLLTAVVLLPFLEAASQTQQHRTRTALYARRELPVNARAMAKRAVMSLLPWYGGQPERGRTTVWDPTNARVGSVALALAAAAPLLAPRRRTWLLSGLAVAGIWLGLNGWPLAQWLHALPLFDITINERLIFAGVFALAMLAGVAVDAWPSSPRRARAAAAIAAVGALGLGLGTLALSGRQVAEGVTPALVTALALAAVLPLLALGFMLARRTPAALAAPLVLFLVLVQRIVEDGSIYPSLPASAFYPEIPILRHLRNDAAEPARLVGLHHAFVPDAAALYGLDDARGYEAMTFLPLAQTFPLWSTQIPTFFNKVDDPSRPFLSFLNVKYVLAPRRRPPDEQWRLVAEDRRTRLFENTRVLARAFVPARVRYEPRPVAVLAGMAAARDFSETAWILEQGPPSRDVANGPGKLRVRRIGAELAIDAAMEADGWVVISESGWRGWRAYVDGQRRPLAVANHAFLGVRVPRGTHHVRLVYLPESFTLGRAISVTAVTTLLGLLALRLYRTRHGGRGYPDPRVGG